MMTKTKGSYLDKQKGWVVDGPVRQVFRHLIIFRMVLGLYVVLRSSLKESELTG